MLLPAGNPFKCHEEVLYLQPIIPPKRFDIFSLTGGCSEGLDPSRIFSKLYTSVCVLSVVIPSILNVRLMDAPAGFIQEEGHTGFLHLPSAVLALIFIARRIQPLISRFDREVEFCVPTK